MTIRRTMLAALAGTCILLSQNRFDDLVRNDIFAGFGGNQNALERGMKVCEELLQKDPQHAEAMVWLGSATSFMGSQAFQKGDTQEGLRLTMKGRAMMDRAVELQPRSIGVRIPRGASLLGGARFQDMSDRLAGEIRKGLEDYLVAYDLQKNRIDGMSAHSKGELLLGIANAYHRLDDKTNAREWFEKIPTAVPDSVYMAKAKKWLETGKLAPMEGGCLGCHVKETGPSP